jgi:hypothetical protein
LLSFLSSAADNSAARYSVIAKSNSGNYPNKQGAAVAIKPPLQPHPSFYFVNGNALIEQFQHICRAFRLASYLRRDLTSSIS